MAKISLKIVSDFKQAENDFKKLKPLTDSARASLEKFQNKLTGDQLDKFTLKNKRMAIAVTATKGKFAGMKQEAKGLEREIQRLIKGGMDPMSREVKGLTKDYDRLQKEMGQTTKASKKNGSQFSKNAKALVGMAAAYLSFQGALRIVKSLTIGLAQQGDELAKTSRRIGMTAEAFQELTFAADRSGLSSNEFSKSIEKMNKNLGDARAGTGMLITFLNKSNPALLTQLKTVSNSEDAFKLLTDEIDKIKNPMDKAALANAAFGRSGTKIINMSEGGTKGIAKLRKEAKKYGGIMSNEAALASEKFVDAQTNLQGALKGVSLSIGSKLIPKVTEMMQKFTEWASKNDNLKNALSNLWDVIKIVTGAFVAYKVIVMAIAAQQAIVGVITGMMAAMKGLTLATEAGNIALKTQAVLTKAAAVAQAALNLVMSLNPIMLVVASIAALGAALYFLNRKTKAQTISEKNAAKVKKLLSKNVDELTKSNKEATKSVGLYSARLREQGKSDKQILANLLKHKAVLVKERAWWAGQKTQSVMIIKGYNDQIAAINNSTRALKSSIAMQKINARQQASSKWLSDKKSALAKYTSYLEKWGATNEDLVKLQYKKELDELNKSKKRKLITEKMYNDVKLGMEIDYSKNIQAAREADKQKERDALKEKIESYASTYSEISGVVSNLAGSLGDLFQAIADKKIAAMDRAYERSVELIDSQMQAELAAAGVSESTEVEKAQVKLAEAIASGDAVTIKEAQDAVTKAEIEEKYRKQKNEAEEVYRKKRAQAEYKAAMTAWKLQISMAAAQVPLAILNAVAAGAKWGPIGMAAFGAAAATAAGVQLAAIKEAKPVAPTAQTGLQNYTVPDTLTNRNDKAAVMASAGETVNVTPRGGDENSVTEINIDVGEYNLFRIINRGISTGKINLSNKNIGAGVFAT